MLLNLELIDAWCKSQLQLLPLQVASLDAGFGFLMFEPTMRCPKLPGGAKVLPKRRQGREQPARAAGVNEY